MAGNMYDQGRQGNFGPWGRDNNQNEMFDHWNDPEDRGGPMRRERMQMDVDRSRNQMGMMRDEMNDPVDWYGDSDFMEERVRNEGRAGDRFGGNEIRTVRRSAKRPRIQHRYEERADSVFQSDQMSHQETLETRAREKDYARDGIGGPFANSAWDRPDSARDNYYHNPPMGTGEGSRDRNAERYQDGPLNRSASSYNFDFTDKGGASAPIVPVTSSWDKPVPAGAEKVVIPVARKRKRKNNANLNWKALASIGPSQPNSYDPGFLQAEQRKARPGGESLYTRRPQRPDEQPQHSREARPGWDDVDLPVSNMDVYRMRMATQAEQQRRREENEPAGSYLKERPEHSTGKCGDTGDAESTFGNDIDEFLYQEQPAQQRPAAEERQDPFWEKLSQRSEERKKPEKEVSTPAPSIGDVLVESLLKHISQKVDSGEPLRSGAAKEGGKSTDITQQLIDLLGSASKSSAPPKEEPKAERQADRAAVFEDRTYQAEAFGRQNDTRPHPVNSQPAAPVNAGPVSSHYVGHEYPGAPTPHPYAQQPLQAPAQPVSQSDYLYGRGPIVPPVQATLVPQAVPPPVELYPQAMHHQLVPQPVPPPFIAPYLPPPQMPDLFHNFSALRANPPPPFLRFGAIASTERKTKGNRWGPLAPGNNQRRAILTPIPQMEKGPVTGFPNKGGRNLTPAARQQSGHATPSYKGGLDKSRSGFPKAAESATKVFSSAFSASASSSKFLTPRDGSSASRGAGSSKAGSSSSKNLVAPKNDSSASKDARFSKDASLTSRPKLAIAPIPKTVEERKSLMEQEVQLRKKVELLRAELNRLKAKCTNIMQNLHYKERMTDPKLNEAKMLQSEIKAQANKANEELLAVGRALKASRHLVVGAPKEQPSAWLAPDVKGSAAFKPSKKQKPIVLNLKPASRPTEHKAPEAPASGTPSKHYRFTDNGDHWCKHCDVVLPLADDLLKHLQMNHHDVMQCVPPGERPWAEKSPECKIGPGEKLTCLPFRGVEFMIPCDSFFCNLCKELFGDLCAARCHLESLKHNANYSKFCKSNPNYAKNIQSVLNAQKKQDKKNKDKDVLADNSQHIDIKRLPSTDKIEEPEVIDIDDDDAGTSAAGKQSKKTTIASTKQNSALKTNTSEKEISIIADIDLLKHTSSNSFKAQKDSKEKGLGSGVTENSASGELGSNAINEENVDGIGSGSPSILKAYTSEPENKNGSKLKPIISIAVDADAVTPKDDQQDSSKSLKTCQDSAKQARDENPFEKVSDDEMIEDCQEISSTTLEPSKETPKKFAEDIFDRISDEEMVEELDNEFEMITDDEVIDDDAEDKGNTSDVDQTTEDMETKGENTGEDLVEDMIEDFGDDAVLDEADITIIDDADEDDENEESAEILIEEEDDGEGNADEKDGAAGPGEEEEEGDSTDIIDVAEDAVVDVADEEDEITNIAAKENGIADVEAEDVIAAAAVEEDEAAEDKATDAAGEEDKATETAGEEDETAEAAGEEDEAVVEEDEAAEDAEEDEAAEVAGEEDEAAEVAGEEDEAAEVAGEEDETAEAAGEEDETAEAAGEEDETAEAAGEEDESAEAAGEEDESAEAAGEEDESAEAAGEEDESAEAAGEEDESAEAAGEEDEAAEAAGDEDKAEESAGEEDDAAEAAGEEDDAAEAAGEEDDAAEAAGEEDDAAEAAGEEVETAEAAVEEDEAAEAAGEEDDAAEAADEEDEATEAADEDQAGNNTHNKTTDIINRERGADNVIKDDKDEGTANAQEENADNTIKGTSGSNVTAEEDANVDSAIKDSVGERNVAQAGASAGDLTKVTENTVEDMDTGVAIEKDATCAAMETVDSFDDNEKNVVMKDFSKLSDIDKPEGSIILSLSANNNDGVPKSTKGMTKMLSNVDIAVVEFSSTVLDTVSLDPDNSDKSNQKNGLNDKGSGPSKAVDLAESQDMCGGLQTSNDTGSSQTLQQKTTVIEADANPKTSEPVSTSLADALQESTSNSSTSDVMEETPNSSMDAESHPAKRRQVAICSRGRGRGAPRGKVLASTPKDVQSASTSNLEGINAAPEPKAKMAPSKYTRGIKPETPTSTRIATRSSRQTVSTVAKPHEVEPPSRPKRQLPKTKPLGGVKRDQSGRPVRGKSAAKEVDEDDVIDLEAAEQTNSKKSCSPEVIEAETKPSGQGSGGRCRRKVTPKRAELLARATAAQKAKEKPEAAKAVPWQITEVVTLEEEEAKKLNWIVGATSGTGKEAKISGLAKPKKMETSISKEGDEGSTLVELSADEDDTKLEKMEAILLGDPCPNSSDVDEVDDACLESDLEIVDEAEDTD